MKSYTVIYKKEAIKFIKIHKLEGTKFFRAFEEISKDITYMGIAFCGKQIKISYK